MKLRLEIDVQGLGPHCRDCRIRQGLSLSQAAADLGVHKSKLSRLENGEGWGLSIDELLRLLALINSPLYAPIQQALADFKDAIASLDASQ